MLEEHREQGNQIREALAKLPALQVEGDIYLKFSKVLDATENILYPDGLQTEKEYKRLIAISKAGCKAIGYSCEEVDLLPPAVPFSERGKYLQKIALVNECLDHLTDEVIETFINELLKNDSEYVKTPHVVTKRKKLAHTLAYKHFRRALHRFSESEQEHLMQRGDEVAKKLGYRVSTFTEPPWLAGETLYVKDMTPDWHAWREAVSKMVGARAYPKVSIVITYGLRAAFNDSVDEDPENIISHDRWCDLFDELGYIYDKEQNRLTPKPINLSSHTTQALSQAISNLPTYNHPKIGDFLIKDDLVQAARCVLGQDVTKGRLEQHITEGVIGRVLIKLGHQLTTRWVSKNELMMLPKRAKKGAEVYTLAMQVDREIKHPTFAKGFTIYSPVLVRDETDLVYMELLGPRQAVKANWAALRQNNRSHYLSGVLKVNKEDKVTTLKTTLPCGWDHWCLIHRQASYDKLTPQEAFYLIDHTPEKKGPPSTFIAFLAKSLAIPILPEWTEYLWISGRMKELITPLTKNCYGYGGWKVETHKWNQIVSDGLAEKKISF